MRPELLTNITLCEVRWSTRIVQQPSYNNNCFPMKVPTNIPIHKSQHTFLQTTLWSNDQNLKLWGQRCPRQPWQDHHYHWERWECRFGPVSHQHEVCHCTPNSPPCQYITYHPPQISLQSQSLRTLSKRNLQMPSKQSLTFKAFVLIRQCLIHTCFICMCVNDFVMNSISWVFQNRNKSMIPNML